ncbi:MAG: hypothetical protein SVZ03_02940 [Spirochaetota bacterium]|nr:hypothetical protein [Spirochaetota bacterium]
MVPIKGDGERDFKEMKSSLVHTRDDIVQKISKNGKEKIELKNKRFTASIGEGVENFKKMFYAQAKKKEYHSAKKVILLTDRATWISKIKEEYFSKAIHILDWYMMVDYLCKTTNALFREKNTLKCEEVGK